MAVIALSGVTGMLRRVTEQALRAHPAVDEVVEPARGAGPGAQSPGGVVHFGPLITGPVLEAAAAPGVRSLVFVSSAMAYGAWPDNPVPLGEDAPLRPNPGTRPAVEAAEGERRVAAWAQQHPDVAVAVLRPCTLAGPGVDDPLARALCDGPRLRGPRPWPPAQFLHHDDLAAAIALVLSRPLVGVFNVAPEGWIDGDELRGLLPGRLRLSAPEPVTRWLDGWARRAGLPGAAAGVMPYLLYPWVVGSDRIRAAGWQPAWRNEEALVEGTRPAWWQSMPPARRQLVALGGSIATLASAGAGGALAVGRRRRRRRRRREDRQG